MAIMLWGGNAVVAKLSAAVISPADVTFFRWLVAALLLAPFAAGPILRHRAELGHQLLRMIVLGLLGCVLFPYLMYVAAGHTTAINIGIIQTLMPLMAIGLSGLLFGFAISGGSVAGALISLLGVVIVVCQGRLDLLVSHPPNRGDLMMLAATACFALYSALLARWRSSLPLTVSLFVQSCTAVVVLLPVIILLPHQAMEPEALPLIAYAGALGSVAAPLLWMNGIARIGSARASIFFNLLPLVTAALAIVTLGEPLTLPLVVGGLLALLGVVLAERAAKSAAARPVRL